MRDPRYLTPAHDVLSYEAEGRTVVLDLGMDGWAAAVAAGPEPFANPPPPNPTLDDYRRAVQAHIDSVAQSRRYDSGVSLASYAADPNPAWSAEAQAFVAWRSAVWAMVYAAEAAQGAAPPPTIEAVIAALPGIVWP